MQWFEFFKEAIGIGIIAMPIFLMQWIARIIRKAMKDQSIRIADILIETDVPPAKGQKKDESKANEGDEPAPVKRSASRFILFLSGITSLVLGTCITSYYFYMKIYCITCADGLSLDDFTNVLLALGIGVVPYTVNQVKKIRL